MLARDQETRDAGRGGRPLPRHLALPLGFLVGFPAAALVGFGSAAWPWILVGQTLAGLCLVVLARRAWNARPRERAHPERMIEALSDGAPDVIIVASDAGGVIRHFSRGAEHALEFTADEVVGRLSVEALHLRAELEERRKEVSRAVGRALTPLELLTFAADARHPGYTDWTLVTKGGRQLRTRLAMTEMSREQDETGGQVCVALDVTHHLHALEALESARGDAEGANRAKSAFLANMSHEIRTPINGVLGMSELLLETALTREQKDFARTIHASSRALLGVLGDILDLSKIEAGRMSVEALPFVLREIVDDVAGLQEPNARKKGLAFESTVLDSVPRRIVGDPVRLRQVLLNLLGNAVKFTSQGRVELVVRLDEVDRNPAQIVFEVRDTGIGIPPEKLASVFDEFSQADNSTTRRFGGTGLGLAISRQLVTLMGGTLEAKSPPGQGSTFTMRLPLSIPDTVDRYDEITGPASREIARAHIEGLRVLLVDDHPVNRQVAQRMLARLGCEIEPAENGKMAVDLFRKNEFDLVLLDCQMPVMDGFEAAAEIRRVEGTSQRTPIVALTAHAVAGDRERCLAAGMDDYLTKPLLFDQLQRCLLRWQEARRATPV